MKKAIFSARAQWKNIGRALALSEGTIDSIHEPEDSEGLHKVLKKWMGTGRAKTQDLLEALEDKTVGRGDIAKELRAREGKERTEVGLSDSRKILLWSLLQCMFIFLARQTDQPDFIIHI